MDSTYPLLPVPNALATVLALADRRTTRPVTLDNALGTVLAADVVAMDPLPPFPASIKDGYAVIAADGPGDYPLIGRITAGLLADFSVRPGSVAYITTGAPLPPGADAVVMVEETETLANDDSASDTLPRVRIHTQVKPGQDIRPVGYDIAQGEIVLRAGERLGPAEIGLAAAVGLTTLPVYAKPRVAILSTGDELIEAGAPLPPGRIRDSNRPMLRAATTFAGGDPLDLGIAGDDPAQLEAAFWTGLAQADILISSGGVSVGELDLIKRLLEQYGVVHFGRLRMKPGKPCTFATVEIDGVRKLIFGLPGNPVSGLVTFYLLVLPATRQMAGWRAVELPRVQAQPAQPVTLDPARPEYQRAAIRWDHTLNHGSGGWLAISTGNQASSRLLSMRSANALLELPSGNQTLEQGAIVSALMIE